MSREEVDVSDEFVSGVPMEVAFLSATAQTVVMFDAERYSGRAPGDTELRDLLVAHHQSSAWARSTADIVNYYDCHGVDRHLLQDGDEQPSPNQPFRNFARLRVGSGCRADPFTAGFMLDPTLKITFIPAYMVKLSEDPSDEFLDVMTRMLEIGWINSLPMAARNRMAALRQTIPKRLTRRLQRQIEQIAEALGYSRELARALFRRLVPAAIAGFPVQPHSPPPLARQTSQFRTAMVGAVTRTAPPAAFWGEQDGWPAVFA